MLFFEYLQNASTEKVHSQMIAWIFSEDNQAITHQQKLEVLKELVGPKFSSHDTIRAVYTEKENVDIVIELGDQLVVIENKIKISQHSNQLEKYYELIESWDSKKHHYLFLSLVGEKPDHEAWQKLTYKALQNALENEKPTQHPHALLLKEYLSNLEYLNRSFNTFLKAPHRMVNVFTHSSLKKYKKIIDPTWTDEQKYVSRNNLETVFQKALFYQIAKDLKVHFDRTYIMESRGVALIDFKRPLKLEALLLNGFPFQYGIQIQGGAIKLQFEYHEAKNKTQAAKAIREKGDSIFRLLQAEDPTSSWRFNKARNDKSAYASISKKLEFQNDLPYYQHSEAELKVVVQQEVLQGLALLRKVFEKNVEEASISG